MQKVIAIRGATTLKENKKQEIISETLRLVDLVIKENNLQSNNIISCIISSTADIDEFYPAAAITESGMLKNTPLFSTLEPPIKNSQPLCIRILLTANCAGDFQPKHIYLGETVKFKTNTYTNTNS